MLMLFGSVWCCKPGAPRPLTAAGRARCLGFTEPGEGGLQLRIAYCGDLSLDRFGLRIPELSQGTASGGWREGQGPLHKDEPRYCRPAEIDIDPLDQERRAVLQFERCGGGDPQFQDAIAAQRLRPRRGGDIGADDGRPIRLQPGGDAAAMPRDNRGGEPRGGGGGRAPTRGAFVGAALVWAALVWA